MVFARAPVAGQCKTRLIPALGAHGAADLHAMLVRRALASACAVAHAAVELWCTPDATHAFFAACACDFPVTLREQGEGDLGKRMRGAFEQALRRHRRAVLIGSDIPGLDTAYLDTAASALQHSPAVFGPAEDGGYVLVALSRSAPPLLQEQLFEGIDWGGPEVMAQTRERLAQAGVRALELATLWDLDRPEDLARMRT